MTPDSIPIRSRFHRRQVCQAYNEAAFKHFLAVERARSLRSQRFLYLVFVSLQRNPGRKARLVDATAMAIFRALDAAVREVDFVGWYQEGRVAAAVLTQSAGGPCGSAATAIASRVVGELEKRLSFADSSNVRLRVIRVGGQVRM